MIIRFNNCAPADRKGVTLKLMADAHCPKLNFDNKDFMFQEAQQINNINATYPSNDHVSYTKTFKIIWFLNHNNFKFL